MPSGPAVVTPVTAGAADVVASPAKPRRFLAIYNGSTTATVYVAFDVAAVAAATAGQITLPPTGGMAGMVQWAGEFVPANAIHVIASAAATPVTILE